MWGHELEERMGRGEVSVGADDHAFHQQVCVTQVSQGLVVLGLCIVVEHLCHKPGVGGVLGGVDLRIGGGLTRGSQVHSS